MQLDCAKKNKTYRFIEPSSKWVNFQEEEAKGNSAYLEDWIAKIESIREELKKAEPTSLQHPEDEGKDGLDKSQEKKRRRSFLF